MEYLPKASQMKAADAFTIQNLDIPSLTLMERAAKSCVHALLESGWSFSHVCVVCGAGNNGGDGFAIGRLLMEKDIRVTAVFIGNPDRMTKECRVQMELFEKMGGAICNEFAPAEYSIIIDALFGVGLSRDIEGKYAQLIEDMNGALAKKFAVDIPSGISADTGNVMGIAFKADKTVTFQNRKFGMELYPGKEFCGEVTAADIGISDALLDEDMDVPVKLSQEDYKNLLPKRAEDSNKGSFGKVLVIAGSKGMSGAAYFNAKSAYLVGAGLVRIYTAKENRGILQTLLPEAIITTYGDEWEGASSEEASPEDAARRLKELVDWADVICIGSGIGMGEASEKILKTTLEYCGKPCVVDADGLNLLAKHKNLLRGGNRIFTPHMKEMERLTAVPVKEIKNDRLSVLSKFTLETGCVCVLKDSRTVIMKPGRRTVLNASGNSCMAKAGAGDVLAGMITGLLAQGLCDDDAAALGAYLHGRAGDLAREELGAYSVLAEDLMGHIAAAMKTLCGYGVKNKK